MTPLTHPPDDLRDPRDLGRTHVAADAWRRAGAYFLACGVVAVASGALGQVIGDVGARRDLSGWPVVAAVAAGVVLLGYGVVWPRGTYVEDRPSRPALQLGFGAVWGLAQGLAFLSIFRAVDRLPLAPVAVGLVGFALVAGFQGAWHDLWWDRRVSPPHNLVRWNPVKVLACHVPNLALSTVLLVRYDDARAFVGLQVVALALSSRAMRFPPPGHVRVAAPGEASATTS